jgi:hypothetical protein
MLSSVDSEGDILGQISEQQEQFMPMGNACAVLRPL